VWVGSAGGMSMVFVVEGVADAETETERELNDSLRRGRGGALEKLGERPSKPIRGALSYNSGLLFEGSRNR